MEVRIQKYMSEQGLASRREAERLILSGKIKINGKIVRELGTKINPEKDTLVIIGQELEKITILYHKPRGITSSRARTEGETIYDLHPEWRDLHIAGRLDKESEGLIILTSDGVLAKKITGDKHETEKEYEVTVRERIRPSLISRLDPGIELSDGITLPVKTKVLDEHTFRISMREGRNHQIRRMCDYLHLTVNRLVRVRIGKIQIGKLGVGQFKEIDSAKIG